MADLSKSPKVGGRSISASRFEQICSGRFEQIYKGGVGVFLPADFSKSVQEGGISDSRFEQICSGRFEQISKGGVGDISASRFEQICTGGLISDKSAVADLSKSTKVGWGEYFCQQI